MKAKKKILSLLLAIAMILGMLPMTAMPVYAADATQIKIWNGTEMQTYTLGTDTLPTGLSWNSTDKRLELDGYDGGRIEQATSGDELTFYVVDDSTIDGGEETALRYLNPTIDGVAGKTLTLTGIKKAVMSITGNCTIKNITVKVDQAGTVYPNGNTLGTSGNIDVRENGRLEVTLNKETDNPYPARGVGHLQLYDNGSANITVTANNTKTTDAYGVTILYLHGTGDCDITVTNNGSGNTQAVQYEPNINSSYDVTGAWNSPSVSYTAADPNTNADLSALNCDWGAVSPTFNPNVTSYTGPNYSYNYNTAGITATVAETGASLKINGEAATSGVLKYVPIAVGENVIPVVVTSKDSSTTKTYTLTITRQSGGSHNLTIVNGTKTPNTDTVEAGDTVTITANTPDTGKVFDKWTSTDGVTFADANNATTTFTMPTKAVTVTATYKNDPDMDTELSNIKVNIKTPYTIWENPALTPVYDTATRTYTLNVGTEYNTIYFYLAEMHSDQSVSATVDGVSLTVEELTNGFQTVQHTLTKAKTVFVFTVTAKDGITTGTYTVTVNRGSGITHALTVINGTTTTPTPAEGDTVTITANPPATGKVFDKWTSTDGVTFANASSSTTTFTMPTNAVTVTATYKMDTELKNIKVNIKTPYTIWENPALTPVYDTATRTYTLNVGTEYNTIYFYLAEMHSGQSVTATIDGETLTVEELTNGFQTVQHTLTKAKTVFVFTVTAKDGITTGTYTVTVNRGSGTTYALTVINGTTTTPTPAEGDTVTITANPPATGKVFDKWTTGDGVSFANASSSTTTFTMPAKAVTVTATYKNDPDMDTELNNIKVSISKPYTMWENPALTPVYDTATRTYTLNVGTEYNTIYFYLAEMHSGQSVTATIDGETLTVEELTNGFQTVQHTLTKAKTVFVFTVTAKDGITTGTYTVTVNRGSGTTYALTVINGTTATPTPAEGDTVTITANPPATGKVFDKWTTGDGVSFANASSSTTTFTMPAKEVTVTATYKNDPDMDTELNNIKVSISKPLTIWENPALTPVYDTATRTYTLNVGTEYNTIYFYLAEMHSGQSVTATVDGVSLTVNSALNGFQTVQHTLTKAKTVFVFTVTAKDGITKDTYTVTVNRSDATVTSIAVNSTSHKTAYKVGETLDVTGLTIEATLSDSSTQTINVTSGMVSGFDSSAVAASQTLTITYDGKTATYNISIGKADGPAAPTGLVGVKPTTAGGSDGKITGTTNLMEYSTDSSFSSPTDCTGTEITGLSAGTYYVRVKETATHEAGTYTTVTVPEGSAATVTGISVNSTSHKTAYKVGETLDVTNLTILVTKSDSTTETINVTSGMVSGFDSSAVAASQTLTITYDGKTATYNISIGKADGPAAPTGLVGVKPTTAGGSDGKITGTTNLMEYSTDSSFSSPTDCTGTEITGLSAGTYYVRVKETATHEAGTYTTVTVPEGSAATVTGISVNSTSHKTAYKVGETLDVTNLTILVTKSDSTTETINVTSGMVTGFDSSAVAASQTLTITYDGKTTTYNISITKADGPAAPTGLVGVKPTTAGGTDGKITGTTALMEYADNSSFSSPTDVTGTEITGLSAGTYYVRVKATTTHEAGAYATVTVPEGSAATVTGISVNSTSHKTAYKVGETLDVTGLTILVTKSDSTTETINVTSGMVSGFDSSAVAASQTLTITYDGKTTIYNITIAKADGPAAPTGLVGVKPTTAGGSDGKITGTTNLMEYSTDSSFSSPTDCTGTEITGLSAGTYYVRIKETATHEAGTYAAVTVPAGSTATYTVTISGNGSGSTGSGSYTAGTTVNIYAGNRSGYTFTGWTSSDVTITGASSKNASFTMPAKNVTIKANWSYNSGSGGGGGSSSSSTNATLSDTKAEFDKNEGDDLKVTLRSGSYALRSIKNGSYTLREGRDYTISGRIVTIKASYLDSLKEGKHSLAFDMSGGTDPVLTIIVTETTETDPQEEKLPVEETVNFEDVKSSDWFYDAVNYVYNAGLMKGNSDTTFNPYTDTTRGMIVTILHRLEGKPKANIANDFTDVGADKYYTEAVAWARDNRIVSGYGDGIFGPENSITREQLAAILMNYAKYKGYDVSMRTDLSKFADGESVSPWAKEAMSWANAVELIRGSQNQLMPTGNAQRSQVAAILQRFLETIAK